MNPDEREAGASSGAPPSRAIRVAIPIAAIALVLLTAGIRIRLASTPLERDEGEYAYAGRLLLQGELPYRSVYNMKFPGIYLSYAAALAVFGQSPAGIRSALLLVNLATVALVFLLARRLHGSPAAALAAAAFAVLSLDRSVQGVFANAEHFVILPAVAGLLLLVKATDEERPALLVPSGFLLGVAVIIKQHAAAR